jgi:vacuolar-type H+-ATPase subunit I/STV1
MVAFVYLALSNVFSISIAVAVYERRYFFGTIKRSWQLVKNDFWNILRIRTMWYLVIFAVMVSAIGMFVLLMSILNAVVGAVSIFGIVGMGLISLFGFLGMLAASLLSAPLDGIMQAMIYFNQRMKTEGFDIELRLVKLKEKQAAQ